MLSFKKVYRDELLQLALILSLLRINNGPNYDIDPFNGNLDLDYGTSWRTLSVLRSQFIHPKNLDSVLLNYERELFDDLNILGRYNRDNIYRHSDVTTYLLNIERISNGGQQDDILSSPPTSRLPITSSSSSSSTTTETINSTISSSTNTSTQHNNNNSSLTTAEVGENELTQEDMDLIEVLWKQDVDLGFSLEVANNLKNDNEKNDIQNEYTLTSTNITNRLKTNTTLTSLTTIPPPTPPLPITTTTTNTIKTTATTATTTTSLTTTINIENDDIEKLKTLKAINDDNIKDESEADLNDPWVGLNYTIDTETGEYVIQAEELEDTLSGAADCGPSCDLPLGDLSLPLPEFLLDEALRLVELDDTPTDVINLKDLENFTVDDPLSTSSSSSSTTTTTTTNTTTTTISNKSSLEQSSSSPSSSSSSSSSLTTNLSTLPVAGTSKNFDFLREDSDFDFFTDMIQTSQFHPPHHRAFQSRMPFVRTMSMEQRWQDLANLLSLPSPAADASGMPHPFSHHHPLHNYTHPHTHGMSYNPEATRGVLLHNATLTPPMGDINATVPYSNIGAGTNLGNAVATSMNLTNSSEPMGEHNTAPHYKLESSHDMMYYQNNATELNQTDGFLSSILNDEDLQLMDMAMNEGMYTMRMLDSNNPISNLSMNGTIGPTPTTTTIAPMSRTEVERMDTSSDSAVSSMGSERVPSLSDGEWCDAGSDSGHTAGEHYATDYQKYRPYDYSYTNRQHPTTIPDTTRLPPVAQKKHQMFGKRYFQEQGTNGIIPHHTPSSVKYEYREPTALTPYGGVTTTTSGTTTTTSTPNDGSVIPKPPPPPELKYSCSMEFGRQTNHLIRNNNIDHVQHNHTYHLPAENNGALHRPISRDKTKKKGSGSVNGGGGGGTGGGGDDEHLTRDEKRARALNVPISVDDIINLPMDEFNERLSKYDLSEPQLSLIRDIRRRGKNKVAAQNCRKRKLDQILSLADEVKDMRDRKLRLINEHEFISNECQRIKDKYQQLYRHVFQNLRDPEGNQYSPYQYSLQTSADGSILIVPRSNSTMNSDIKESTSQASKE